MGVADSHVKTAEQNAKERRAARERKRRGSGAVQAPKVNSINRFLFIGEKKPHVIVREVAARKEQETRQKEREAEERFQRQQERMRQTAFDNLYAGLKQKLETFGALWFTFDEHAQHYAKLVSRFKADYRNTQFRWEQSVDGVEFRIGIRR